MNTDHQHHTLLQAHRRLWRARIKRVLKHLPRRSNVARYPVLKYIARWTRGRPELWSYRAPSTTRAYYIGSVVTFLPIMGLQIFIAAMMALLFRANLSIVAGLQLVSNPLTGPFMYLGSYQTGKGIASVLHIQAMGWAGDAAVYLSIGGVVLGLVLGAAIHLGVHMGHHRNRRFIKQPLELS